MNIALGALIIILLLSSVITFKPGVTRANENLRGLMAGQSLSDSFWFFIVVPLLFNLLFLLTVGYFSDIRYDVLYNLIIGNKDLPLNNAVFHRLLIHFLCYALFSLGFGYALGTLLGIIDRRTNWLKRLLGLDHTEWYSLFEGYSPAESEAIEYDFIMIDVLSNTKETTTIYSGLLVEYFFKPRTNDLEYLVLKAATRRDLRKEQLTATPAPTDKALFYSVDTGTTTKIPGQYFIIPMKEVLNINVSYTRIVDASLAAPPDAEPTPPTS